MSKMLNTEVQLSRRTPERPGIDQPAEQASTLGRLTPARYRFPEAAADSAYHASIINDSCLEITPAVRCRTYFLEECERKTNSCSSVHSIKSLSLRVCPDRYLPSPARLPLR